MNDQKEVLKEALEVVDAFLKRDEDKACRFCSKDEWGIEKHDSDCPFGKGYAFILKYPG